LIKNELHNLTSVEPAFTTRSSGNGKISFNWDITSVCNYRCPYCWFYGKWTELKKNDVRIPVDTLKRFWEKIYNQYGSVKVFITGGEPFLYPDFIDLISNISNWHKVEIVTNLSWSARGIVERIANLEIKIHPSFHPLFANFEEFLDKLIILREKKLADNPSYVAWPPQISLLKHYAKQFKDYGIDIFAQTFYGEYKGRKYPDSYSDVEKELIRPFLGERGGKPFQTETKRTKGKLCYAGSLYGVIHADGNVLRCGGLNSEDAKVGNILEEDFTLLQGASLCTSEICPCNEWASLLKEEIE
jgi:MoaA/NifB/PqqE/SkfB family radical SAM enzyme